MVPWQNSALCCDSNPMILWRTALSETYSIAKATWMRPMTSIVWHCRSLQARSKRITDWVSRLKRRENLLLPLSTTCMRPNLSRVIWELKPQ